MLTAESSQPAVNELHNGAVRLRRFRHIKYFPKIMPNAEDGGGVVKSRTMVKCSYVQREPNHEFVCEWNLIKYEMMKWIIEKLWNLNFSVVNFSASLACDCAEISSWHDVEIDDIAAWKNREIRIAHCTLAYGAAVANPMTFSIGLYELDENFIS